MNEDIILYDTVDERVANIQIILNMMGHDVRTDGYFDDMTKEAVEDIQSTNTLPVTGNIDENTLAIINAALQAYVLDAANDTQLQAAITYAIDHPEDPNE